MLPPLRAEEWNHPEGQIASVKYIRNDDEIIEMNAFIMSFAYGVEEV